MRDGKKAFICKINSADQHRSHPSLRERTHVGGPFSIFGVWHVHRIGPTEHTLEGIGLCSHHQSRGLGTCLPLLGGKIVWKKSAVVLAGVKGGVKARADE